MGLYSRSCFRDIQFIISWAKHSFISTTREVDFSCFSSENITLEIGKVSVNKYQIRWSNKYIFWRSRNASLSDHKAS